YSKQICPAIFVSRRAEQPHARDLLHALIADTNAVDAVASLNQGFGFPPDSAVGAIVTEYNHADSRHYVLRNYLAIDRIICSPEYGVSTKVLSGACILKTRSGVLLSLCAVSLI